MRIYIEDKAFDLELIGDSLLVREFGTSGFRWTKFPSIVLQWVANIPKCCSSLSNFVYQKRFGFIDWRIQSGWNHRGWFLEPDVIIRGSYFSIFVPGLMGDNPWKCFIDAFFKFSYCNYLNEVFIGLSQDENLDWLGLHIRGDICSVNRNFKLGIDELFELESSGTFVQPLSR